MSKSNRQKRKGFSLVELVIVILIIAVLAVAVFAGGSVVIKKAQIARTTSDLHNFAIAVESFMNENPSVLNISNFTEGDTIASVLTSFNANLPEEYQIDLTDMANSIFEASANGNIFDGQTESTDITSNLSVAPTTSAIVFKSKKTDAWGNNYYIIGDHAERHGTSNSDFYITVVSAGPDAKSIIGGAIGGNVPAGKEDDIFLLVQNTNGDVSSEIYNMATDSIKYASVNSDGTWDVTTIKCSDAEHSYTYAYQPTTTDFYDSDLAAKCPVNF
jgi:prepilin-type N-terminal cleavage/methylation domain-containing protein